MAGDWTYLVTDLRSGTISGELPLVNDTWTKMLNGAGTGQATLPLSNLVKGDPYTLTTPGRTAVYALRDGNPWWGGIVWTRRYSSRTGVVELGASDWWSYYDHRKVLPALVGGEDYAGLAVSYNQVEQNQIARNLVTLAHSHTGGDIGVQLDTTASGVLRDRNYYGYELSNVGEVLRQLTAIDGGPDIMFDVGANVDSSGRPIKLMRIGTPQLGTSGAPHVFETGGNITDYDWPSDATRMATRSWALGEGIEAGQLMAMAEDSTRYTDGWPLLEQEMGYTTVSQMDTLQGHADADQHAARLPVVLPSLTVAGTRHPPFGTYGPGDDVRMVLQDDFIRSGVDTRVRIVQLSVSPGAGFEEIRVTVSPLTEDLA